MLSDPDRFALSIVQQWLHEQGYDRALAALEQEAGLRVKDEPEMGSQLMQLVYDRMEAELAASAEDDAIVQRRQLEEQLLSGGSAGSPGDCPSRLLRSIEGLHSSNIICIQCRPSSQQAITGSSDGTVTVFAYDGTLVRHFAAASSGVLCLAVQADSSGNSAGQSGLDPSPTTSSGSGSSGSGSSGSGSSGSGSSGSSIVAAGCMDGSVVGLDTASGSILAHAQPHRKYVVAAQWAPDGQHLVTASWDESFCVHRLQRRQQAQQAPLHSEQGEAAVRAASSSGGSSSSGGGSDWELVTCYREQCPAKVNALLFLPASTDAKSSNSSTGSSSSSFLVAVQGSNYLRELSITPAAASGSAAGSTPLAPAAALAAGAEEAVTAVREERRINMNASGDDHVSWSAVHLALSPCGRLLLASADNGRLVVYERAGWTQVRQIFGLPTEQFHQHSAVWHRSGHYIMAAAAHGGVCLFHLGSAKLVCTLPAHIKNVRGLAYDAASNLLLTCSFDRTCKIFEAAAAHALAV